MTARYLLCPGLVTSRTDGDRHYVDAPQLAMLYGVPMAECLVLPGLSPGWDRMMERRSLLDRAASGELVGLVPRADGDYRLPEARS